MRKLLADGRTEDGKPIHPGESFLTATGRLTNPYPKQSGLKYQSGWLIENACAEAKARSDHLNHLIFGSERYSKSGELPQASVDSMLLYLFGTPMEHVLTRMIKASYIR